MHDLLAACETFGSVTKTHAPLAVEFQQMFLMDFRVVVEWFSEQWSQSHALIPYRFVFWSWATMRTLVQLHGSHFSASLPLSMNHTQTKHTWFAWCSVKLPWNWSAAPKALRKEWWVHIYTDSSGRQSSLGTQNRYIQINQITLSFGIFCWP